MKLLSYGFPLDTVQMPLNPFDASFRSFQQLVLPEAQKQAIAVLGVKRLCGSDEMVVQGAITVEMAAIECNCQVEAGDGHLEIFKTTVKYDGKIGRQQHEYPTLEELPV